MLRNVDVTAYPTIGGISGKQARIEPSMKPVLRGRMSNNSMTLQTVGVSYFVNSLRLSTVSGDVIGGHSPYIGLIMAATITHADQRANGVEAVRKLRRFSVIFRGRRLTPPCLM